MDTNLFANTILHTLTLFTTVLSAASFIVSVVGLIVVSRDGDTLTPAETVMGAITMVSLVVLAASLLATGLFTLYPTINFAT